MSSNTKNYLLGNESYVRDAVGAQPADITQFSSAGLVPDFANYDGMPDYINHNTIPFVIHLPTMFQVLGQDGTRINAAIKNMIENHFVTIEGLNKRLDVDTYDTEFGGGGEKWQNDTNVTRQQSNIVTGINDKRNRACQRLLEFWIRCKAGDENSKTPLISLADKSLRYNELLPSMYSAVVAFVTPNETKTRVDKAWLALHFWPKTAGENTGSKDITVKGVGNQLSIEWFSTCQHSVGVDELGQTLLDQMNRPALNPGLFRAAVNEIHPDVKAATTGALKLLDEQYKDMKHVTNNMVG